MKSFENPEPKLSSNSYRGLRDKYKMHDLDKVNMEDFEMLLKDYIKLEAKLEKLDRIIFNYVKLIRTIHNFEVNLKYEQELLRKKWKENHYER